jgi:hypothetical protein
MPILHLILKKDNDCFNDGLVAVIAACAVMSVLAIE